jgi:hypothetical protein
MNRLQLILIYMNQRPRFFGFKEITNCMSHKVGMEGKGLGWGGGRKQILEGTKTLLSVKQPV